MRRAAIAGIIAIVCSAACYQEPPTAPTSTGGGVVIVPPTGAGNGNVETPAFTSGQKLVGAQITAGRYFADPASGCYWERLSGLGGSLGEILANDFLSFDSPQIVVDIRSTDKAFNSTGCGSWYTSIRRPFQTALTPGAWVINAQIASGTYQASAGASCYWERLSAFDGTLSSVIANNFVSTAGSQSVTIGVADVGFYSSAECGTWTKTSSSLSSAIAPVDSISIESARRDHRRRIGQ